jgi:hypothetical protein
MVGMAQKPRTRASRISALWLSAMMILLGAIGIHRAHGAVGFLFLFQIAVAVLVIFVEVKALLEEPN